MTSALPSPIICDFDVCADGGSIRSYANIEMAKQACSEFIRKCLTNIASGVTNPSSMYEVLPSPRRSYSCLYTRHMFITHVPVGGSHVSQIQGLEDLDIRLGSISPPSPRFGANSFHNAGCISQSDAPCFSIWHFCFIFNCFVAITAEWFRHGALRAETLLDYIMRSCAAARTYMLEKIKVIVPCPHRCCRTLNNQASLIYQAGVQAYFAAPYNIPEFLFQIYAVLCSCAHWLYEGLGRTIKNLLKLVWKVITVVYCFGAWLLCIHVCEWCYFASRHTVRQIVESTISVFSNVDAGLCSTGCIILASAVCFHWMSQPKYRLEESEQLQQQILISERDGVSVYAAKGSVRFTVLSRGMPTCNPLYLLLLRFLRVSIAYHFWLLVSAVCASWLAIKVLPSVAACSV